MSARHVLILGVVAVCLMCWSRRGLAQESAPWWAQPDELPDVGAWWGQERESWSFAAQGANEGQPVPAPAIDKWTWRADGEAKKRMPEKKVEEGRLVLLESWSRSSAAASPRISMRAETMVVTDSSELMFDLVMTTGTEGMGVVLLDTNVHGESGVPDPMQPSDSPDPGGNPMIEVAAWGWEAPNFRGALGIGFDASNPVNRDPFRGSGNAYDRAQHEVSIHWDGLEIFKKTTKRDFRDGKAHRVKISTRNRVGGSEVSVTVGDEIVFDQWFVPGAVGYLQRPAFGARNGENAGDVSIGEVTWDAWLVAGAQAPAKRVVVMDRARNDKDRHRNEATVDLPGDLPDTGRIIATVRLDKPPTRFDPWDRLAHVWIDVPKEEAEPGAKPERFELLRYVTPYHRGWQWSVDVTDLRPLLRGRRTLTQECVTYADGWLVSVWLDYYPGWRAVPEVKGKYIQLIEEAERLRARDRVKWFKRPLYAGQVINLWQGAPEIGNPEKPIEQFYTAREVKLPAWVRAARVRMTVSGHGMSPNDRNAAEFMAIDRVLRLSGAGAGGEGGGEVAEFKDRFWKDDVYLNPCRPQGGTWKYDRAAWAPGDVVRPWVVDVPAWLVRPGETLKVAYELAPYVNAARGKASPPIHVTEAQLILYGEAED